MLSLALRISQMHPYCCLCEIGKMITEGIVWAIIDYFCVLLNKVKCFRTKVKKSSSLYLHLFVYGRPG